MRWEYNPKKTDKSTIKLLTASESYIHYARGSCTLYNSIVQQNTLKLLSWSEANSKILSIKLQMYTYKL